MTITPYIKSKWYFVELNGVRYNVRFNWNRTDGWTWVEASQPDLPVRLQEWADAHAITCNKVTNRKPFEVN